MCNPSASSNARNVFCNSCWFPYVTIHGIFGLLSRFAFAGQESRKYIYRVSKYGEIQVKKGDNQPGVSAGEERGRGHLGHRVQANCLMVKKKCIHD